MKRILLIWLALGLLTSGFGTVYADNKRPNITKDKNCRECHTRRGNPASLKASMRGGSASDGNIKLPASHKKFTQEKGKHTPVVPPKSK